MSQDVLFVGGCRASYHRLEPAEPPIRAALEALGLSVDVSGIRHPSLDSIEGDYGSLNAATLEKYDALVLFTTGQDQGEDVDAILSFVRSGKALIGIHCASDSFKSHANYIAALGAAFRTHPDQLDIAVEFTDPDHPITQGLRPFTVHDELYLFKDYQPERVHLLAQTHSLDDDGPVPLCWTREEGAGRVFFLSLGHNPEVMADPHWRALFQRGVLWSLNRLPSP